MVVGRVGWRAGSLRRLRIAMVSTPFIPVPPPRYGGTELVVHELVKGLCGAGHEVVLFATGDSRAPCTVRSLFSSAAWPPDLLDELAHASWAAEAIRSAGRPFDVIHTHVGVFLPWAESLGVPVVYTLHHDRDERRSRFYDLVAPQVEYVAISAEQARLHPELRRCTVIHHGLDPADYPFGERGEGYLAFLGRYSEVKGPDVAIEVAGRLGRELRMGGRIHDFEQRGDFEKRLEALLARPHVRDLGEMDLGRKTALLAGADALLFPVRWNEPFGLVMVEAMLCGCPVVAFRGGSVEEVIEPGVTGFVVDDAGEMERALRDGVPRLDRRRVRARAIERFSSSRMVRDYLALYERAIDASAAAAAPRLEVVR